MMAASSLALSAALEPVANHLWQSTLFLAIAASLTLALRNNRAQARYWLWLAASMKFLVPFAPLMAIGRQFGWRSSATLAQPDMSFLIDTMSQPFSRPEFQVAAVTSSGSAPHGLAAVAPIVLIGIWLLGSTAVLLTWCAGWRRVAAAVRQGFPIEDGREVAMLRRLEQIGGLKRPIAIIASNTSFEPGVFGMAKPVLLWPRNIGGRLDDGQLEAILAHEVCHVRRRDNLAVAVHMFVEAVFWFHPLIWWVETHLVDERERACDEEVIRWGSQPHVYAESILKTCEFCTESPLTCVSGVTGSDLKKRIEAIMRSHGGERLNAWKKALLTTTGIVTVAAPLVIGALGVPELDAQSPGDRGGRPSFDSASVKPNKSGARQAGFRMQPGGSFAATNVMLRTLIVYAYGLERFEVTGGPGWVTSDRFDIVAKAEGNPARDQMLLMLQSLLTERFRLTLRKEARELPIYALVMARSDGKMGPRLRKSEIDCTAVAADAARGIAVAPPTAPVRDALMTPAPACGMRFGPGVYGGGGQTMAQLAGNLSGVLNRRVLDRTGLSGTFDVALEWMPDPSEGGPGALEPPPGLVDQAANTGPSIFTAVQEQLGLKLDSTKGPVDVFVIDRAERPTDNQAELAVPSPPRSSTPQSQTAAAGSSPAFDAASVKPIRSGDRSFAGNPNARVSRSAGGICGSWGWIGLSDTCFSATNITLRELIAYAFGPSGLVPPIPQISDGPSWIDADRFNVVARAAGNVPLEPFSAEQLTTMMRTLLAERFKLTLHHESRALPIYELLVARSDRKIGPQLRPAKADCIAVTEALRARPGNAPSVSRHDPCIAESGRGYLKGGAIDMSQLALMLSNRLNRVVRDQSGLAGFFAIDLTWTVDPNVPSLFAALQEQLGLKLDSTKGQVDVLAIDHVEQPTPD